MFPCKVQRFKVNIRLFLLVTCVIFSNVDHSLFINCGGSKIKFKDDIYESDLHLEGTFRSLGLIVAQDYHLKMMIPTFLTPNLTSLDSSCPEYCQTGWCNSLSLKYCGLCMMEGNYTVKLHFAEIILFDDHTYRSHSRRI